MHHSLFIRDLLKAANADPRYRARRDPHRGVFRDPAATAPEGEFELAGRWRVAGEDDPVLAPAVEDLAEFLDRMGVDVGPEADREIVLRLVGDLGDRDCRLRYGRERIVVEGGGPAGLWAGLAWTEREMRIRRGPWLPEGEFARTAAWGTQISQGPWGGNYSVPDFSPEYLSDDSFRLYAHYGVNAMMIYGDLMCYVRSAILPELNHPEADAHLAMLKDASARAARYGVRFSWLVVGPKLRATHPVFRAHPSARGSGFGTRDGTERVHFLCSSDERVLAFYDELFRQMFSEVPQLAGLVLIIGGESFYHCRMWPHAEAICPRCGERTTEEVVSRLVGVVRRAVADTQPAAYVTAWAYNTGGWERPDRLELVRQLPAGVAIYHHIDKDQHYRKAGYTKHVWDYSVDYVGPSDNMLAVAAAAREVGRDLFVKTETGIGLEVFQFPYVPAMQRLAEKWRNVRALRPAGVQQSWLFFGMFGSRAEELGLWAAYAPDVPRDAFLRQMAVRDFGPAAADLVMQAWQRASDAVGHIPCMMVGTYYVGPTFLGPCHPLVPDNTQPVPDVFRAVLFYLQEGEETFSHRFTNVEETLLALTELAPTAAGFGMAIQWEGGGDGWDIVEREFAAAAELAGQAWTLLRQAAPLAAGEADARNLREEALLTELLHRTFVSCANTVRFLTARRRLEETGDTAFRETMRRVAVEERENALAATHVYDEAPWLDLALRLDGRFSPCAAMIEEKVRLIDAFLARSPRGRS